MLDTFFITGAVPANIETGTYIPFLIFISYLVASLGSYMGLKLATSIGDSSDNKTKELILLAGALALGSGIWSMHFIGMLSYRMNMAVSYNYFLTALSMATAILIAYAVLRISCFGARSLASLGVGSLLLGIAICGMHYIGMAAMEMGAELRYLPLPFFLSVAIAISASAAALSIIFILKTLTGRRRKIFKGIAALIMGAAICGMHYTGMAAAVFVPLGLCPPASEQNFNVLALTVTLVTSVIFAVVLAFYLVLQERVAREENKDYPFPTKSVVFTSVLTLVAVIWAVGSCAYIDHRVSAGINVDLKSSQLGSQIAYIDTVADRALRMAVVRLLRGCKYQDFMILLRPNALKYI